MIKFTDLRCGNIILQHFEGGEGTMLDVTSRIIFDCQTNPTGKFTYSGVLITPEILDNLGFRYLHPIKGDSERILGQWNLDGEFTFIIEGVYGGFQLYAVTGWFCNLKRNVASTVSATAHGHIKYLHQLQNVFNALTGKELKHTLIEF